MLLSMLFIQLRSLEAQILDTLTKLALLALFVQPFVHIAGSRYWTTAGPLFVLAAAGFLRESYVRRRYGRSGARAPRGHRRPAQPVAQAGAGGAVRGVRRGCSWCSA